MKCTNCGVDTTNPKFCSRSCAQTYNNKVYPKRKPEGKCRKCQGPSLSKHTYCSDCWDSRVKDMTLKEAMYTKHHKSSAFALVRTRARSVVRPSGEYCRNCGYDKHVEVCHIKPIKNFHEDTYISEINSLDNLILLCPNCHWELDHGRLTL